MDIRKVKKLIELLEESDIAEIEIHEGEESVRISRQSAHPAQLFSPARLTHPQLRRLRPPRFQPRRRKKYPWRFRAISLNPPW